MHNTIRILLAATALAAFGPAAAATVGTSDLISVDSLPANSCASPDPACTTAILVPAPGFAHDRQVIGISNVTRAEAAALENGILVVEVKGQGILDTTAYARFQETYRWTGAPGPALVAFHIDLHNLGQFAGGLPPLGLTRSSRFAFTIEVDGDLKASLDWSVGLEVNGLNDEFVSEPAPFGFDPTPIALTNISMALDSFVTADGPAGTILVDLGPLATNQIFTLDYNMLANVFGDGGDGEGFSGVGDPFTIPTVPGIDFFGNAVPFQVPAPTALPLFGLGALALAGRMGARRRAA